MKKISLALALCCASFYSMADQLPLGGFSYGPMEAPTGKEWESPENLALNKEQPHAYIFPFQDVESARKVLPENSKFWQSLDGDWKFNWAPDPDSRPKDFYKTEFDVSGWDNIPVPSSWNIYGVQKDGSLKYGVPIYVNQPVIFQHKVAVDDWRGGVTGYPSCADGCRRALQMSDPAIHAVTSPGTKGRDHLFHPGKSSLCLPFRNVRYGLRKHR